MGSVRTPISTSPLPSRADTRLAGEIKELLVAGDSVQAGGRFEALVERHHRRAAMKTFLDSITEENEQAFEAAFPVERLAAQRARILRRLSKVSDQQRPARILRFPAIARPALTTVHAARRCLVAAAAAGLLVGLSIGQPVHLHPDSELRDPSTPAGVVSEDMSFGSLAQRPLHVSDEAFMNEVELVLSSPQGQELSTLDAITPRIRKMAINLW